MNLTLTLMMGQPLKLGGKHDNFWTVTFADQFEVPGNLKLAGKTTKLLLGEIIRFRQVKMACAPLRLLCKRAVCIPNLLYCLRSFQAFANLWRCIQSVCDSPRNLGHSSQKADPQLSGVT